MKKISKTKKPKTKRKKYIPLASGEEIKPYYNEGKSIQEIEMDEGHGFWGNSSSGYISDEDSKRNF